MIPPYWDDAGNTQGMKRITNNYEVLFATVSYNCSNILLELQFFLFT